MHNTNKLLLASLLVSLMSCAEQDDTTTIANNLSITRSDTHTTDTETTTITTGTQPTPHSPSPSPPIQDGRQLFHDPLQGATYAAAMVNLAYVAPSGVMALAEQNSYLLYRLPIYTPAIVIQFQTSGLIHDNAKRIVLQVSDAIDEKWLGGSSAWLRYSLFDLRIRNNEVRVKIGGHGETEAEWSEGYTGAFLTGEDLWAIHITSTCDVYLNHALIFSKPVKGFAPAAPLGIRLLGSPVDQGVPSLVLRSVTVSLP